MFTEVEDFITNFNSWENVLFSSVVFYQPLFCCDQRSLIRVRFPRWMIRLQVFIEMKQIFHHIIAMWSTLCHYYKYRSKLWQVSTYNSSFEWLIHSYNCMQIHVSFLHAEKIAEVVLLNLFRIEFPASLLVLMCFKFSSAQVD